MQLLADRVRSLLGSAKLEPCPPSPAGSTDGGETTPTPRRIPPGQYLTPDFPVLSAGPTPHTPLDEWSLTIHGAVDEPRLVVVGGVPRAARRDLHRRHPLRDEVVQARHDVDRRLGRHAARGRRHRGRVPHRVVGRRLHDQPAAGGRQRRQGVGRLRVRRRAARPRARRPGAAARAAPVLLEEREVGARAGADRSTTSRASGRPPATTTTGTHGASSGTGATDRPRRITWRAATVREVVAETPRARTLVLDVPEWPGPPRRPARRRAPDRRGRLPGAALLLDRLGARARRARAHRRARRRRRGLALLRGGGARRRHVRGARADRRALLVDGATTAARCCWSAAARASCR